jgi:hypothetical protein
MMSIVIRHAPSADIPALAALRAETWGLSLDWATARLGVGGCCPPRRQIDAMAVKESEEFLSEHAGPDLCQRDTVRERSRQG